MITRIKQRTATIDTDDGQNWRVGFALLRQCRRRVIRVDGDRQEGLEATLTRSVYRNSF